MMNDEDELRMWQLRERRRSAVHFRDIVEQGTTTHTIWVERVTSLEKQICACIDRIEELTP